VNALILESVLVVLLILGNGLLAMSEMAIVSGRRVRLQQRVKKGDRSASLALGQMSEPGRYLSTVQVGITLVGILAGALGGATIAKVIDSQIRHIAILAPYSRVISLVLVVLGVSYLSLVIGELVPKRLALTNPERIACAAARPMERLSILVSPLVTLLTFSTEAVLRLLRVRASPTPPVTQEELSILIEEGAKMGVFDVVERDLMEQVLRLGERSVKMLMTHRKDIVWLDVNDSPAAMARKLTHSVHSRYPVARGNLDEILGIVYAKDLLTCSLTGAPINVTAAIQEPLFVPKGVLALTALELFRERQLDVALVVDDYGSIIGLVTANDVLETLVGDIPVLGELFKPKAVKREDGSWLVDGMLPIDEFKAALRVDELPGASQGQYETFGGFVMKSLRRIPSVADRFDWNGLQFEVLQMDGRRVDKVQISMKSKDQSKSDTGVEICPTKFGRGNRSID
jgi:putative hemolysin